MDGSAPPAQRRAAALGLLLVTGMVLAVVAVQALFRGDAASREDVPPTKLVDRWMDAAAAGDVETLLLLADGEVLEEIEREIAASSREDVAETLIAAQSAVKGYSVAEAADSGEDRAVAEVELIYADQREVQQWEFVRRNGNWFVARQARGEREDSLVPYGTPVVPEGQAAP